MSSTSCHISHYIFIVKLFMMERCSKMYHGMIYLSLSHTVATKCLSGWTRFSWCAEGSYLYNDVHVCNTQSHCCCILLFHLHPQFFFVFNMQVRQFIQYARNFRLGHDVHIIHQQQYNTSHLIIVCYQNA